MHQLLLYTVAQEIRWSYLILCPDLILGDLAEEPNLITVQVTFFRALTSNFQEEYLVSMAHSSFQLIEYYVVPKVGEVQQVTIFQPPSPYPPVLLRAPR